ncbi:non-specific serine/threonine protein kinase [Ranunculus cassubicifolius]
MFLVFLLSPVIAFFLLTVTLSFHLTTSAFIPDHPQFLNCSNTRSCGNIETITYPFWGNGTAQYCGQPGFQLKCLPDSAEIQIQSKTYRVLHINAGIQTLRISKTDSWNDNCPLQFINSSLPSNLLVYSIPSTQTLTLFYGCPLILEISTNKFTCSMHNNTRYNYFWNFDTEVRPLPRNLSRCNVSVVVPVLQSVVRNFTSSQSTIEQLLTHGFDAKYLTNVSACDKCETSGGRCGYDSNISRQICFCSDQQRNTSLIAILVGAFILGIIVTICCGKRKQLINCLLFCKRKKKAQILVENFLENYGSLAPKRFSYSDVKKITKSFKDKIGQGGYGAVYKGNLKDGRLVAVKILNKDKSNGEDFINEVESISQTSHVNIVSLYGFCYDGSRKALLYEFMANGSLEKFIFDHNPLSEPAKLGWETLHRIAIGVARGLEYLHRGCNTRILHFDIKPHNILLDQDFIPKISDFGLAKVCQREQSIVSMFGARGTIGYIAPEIVSRNFGEVSYKSDVYSYGMMVLEIVGKRKNLDVGVERTSEIYFPHWVYRRLELDEDLGLHGVLSQEDGEMTRKMIIAALWCIQPNPIDRPTMSKVVEMLEGTNELLPIPPPPYSSSPPRDLLASIPSET